MQSFPAVPPHPPCRRPDGEGGSRAALGRRIAIFAVLWINVFAVDWASSDDAQAGGRIARAFHVGDEAEALPPEYRLWSALLAAPAFPIALPWLGWTNDASISPWSSLGACVLLGFSWAGIYVTVYQHLLDTYGIHAGSALAPVTCWRSGVSGLVNLVSRPMYQGLGVHWTMTWMGGLAGVQCPLPWIFYQYGPRIRARSHFAGQYSRPQNQRDRTGAGAELAMTP